MQGTTLLRECVEVLRKFTVRCLHSDEAWQTFSAANRIDPIVKPDVDRLIEWLPTACERLAEVLEDPLETRQNKLLSSVAINYVLMPFDVIPDNSEVNGYYGFLDDAVLVSLCIGEMNSDAPLSVRAVAQDYLPSVDKIRAALPAKLNADIDNQLRALRMMVPAPADHDFESEDGE